MSRELALEIVYLFVVIVRIVVALSIALFIAACLWGLIRALGQGDYGRAALLAFCAVLPFILFGLSRLYTSSKTQSRSEFVAALPRSPLSSNPPRVLELQDVNDSWIATSLLNTGVFDQVISVQPQLRGLSTVQVTVYAPNRSPKCVAQSERYLTDVYEKSRGTPPDKDCQAFQNETYDPSDMPRDAVVIMMNHRTTLHQGNTLWSNGAIEIRERSGGKNTLIDYRETAHDSEAVSPFSIETRTKPSSESLDIAKIILTAIGWKPKGE